MSPDFSDEVIYALSDRVLYNIHKTTIVPGIEGKSAQDLIDSTVSQLKAHLGNNIDIRTLPVLFSGFQDGSWIAETPNFTNCLVADAKAFMDESIGPEIGGINYFHEEVMAKLNNTGIDPVFVDAFRIRMNNGEVHCASNTRRAVLSGANWWDAWPLR